MRQSGALSVAQVEARRGPDSLIANNARDESCVCASATVTASARGGGDRVINTDIATQTAATDTEFVDNEERGQDVIEVLQQSVLGLVCELGQFRMDFPNPSCKDCDENCLGDCADGSGCEKCREGFFTSREDAEWPLKCRVCTIENCAECVDGVLDASPMRCSVCVQGFEVVNDGDGCREEVNPSIPRGLGSSPFNVNEQSIAQEPQSLPLPTPINTVSQNVDSGCSEGSFFKPFDQTCMECDQNCSPGNCLDDIGCQECVQGFFTSREDEEWPRRCKPCVIENCRRCRNDIFDAWPTQCDECEDGFNLATGSRKCISDKVDIGVTEQSLNPVRCPGGSFLKAFDGSCMVCDSNCLPGQCVDDVGCRKCNPGFYRC